VIDRVLVRGLSGLCRYTVVDGQGRAVLTGRTTGEGGVEVSALAMGSYVLCLAASDGKPGQRMKFMKE